MIVEMFEAKDGTLINPVLVMTVRINRQENKYVVRFTFGSYSRELLFDRKDDAEKQVSDFARFCTEL